MSKNDYPQTETISHNGSANTAVPTRDSNNNIVGEGVVAKQVQLATIINQAGSVVRVTLEDFDPNNNAVDNSMELPLVTDEGLTVGEQSDEPIFTVPRGHRLRVNTDGAADVNLELTDDRV